ncbi:adenylyltransferase/cytidyltransferase family protein [Alkalibacter rhizosphaerae]|uniref:Adenylyltransferase/cytidyltransferase family protein n=1 Tax=Alkalibacter rhizosphaerae TaxID=2815577 RepID=A0A974XH37_9FIRM|nr:adenylyltransferase/cytidyltransferase family protein [Alkalibacter rhizosphaerae]QSX09591.1 adenylyltransferase/cytidyltransferase family protein [Alkalibacter rhizosphaerae]
MIKVERSRYHVGYTTGVFDLFHIGHLNLIKNAKALCDHLIVGVNTDELVKEYKGKVPVISFEQRLEIIGSIKYVDEAIAQTNLDKLEAWKTLHFDALFQGDDWKGHPRYIKTEADLKTVHSDMIFLPYTKEISTTLLIQKIRNE